MTMTKKGLCKIESWLRVVGLALLGGVGFCLLLHDLDAEEPTMVWYWNLLARVAGAGMMYLTYRVGKALYDWGMLPHIMYEDELED